MRIAIVGPCAAGKSVLAQRLRARGYDVREPAQEHSGVPDLWRRMASPDLLIYLDAGLAAISRRGRLGWTEEYLAEQRRRLAHARQRCDCYVLTDDLTEEEVFQVVMAFLRRAKGE